VGGARVTRAEGDRRPELERTPRDGADALRLLVDGAQDSAVFGLSADGHIVTWNMGATRLQGYWAEEILGQHVSRLYPPDDVQRGKPEEELRKAAEDGRYETEGWRVRWDGSRFWASVVIIAERDPTGAVSGFSQVTRDRTDRKRAEDAARALADVGRVLAKSMNAAEMGQRIADEIRILLECNNAALYCLDVETQDVAVLATSGEVKSALSRLLLQQGIGAPRLAIQERRPVVIRDLLTDPRMTLSVEVRVNAVHSPHRAMLAVPLLFQERIIGALGVLDRAGRVFLDDEIRLSQAFADQAALGLENARLYQESVRAYEELLRAQEQVARAQKIEAVGRLAGGVAHDFNNLLTVITACSQFLLNRLPLDDPLRRDIELIDKAAQGAGELTGQLLAFSRKQPLALTVLDLNSTVESIAPMLRRLMGERIEVVTLLEPALGLMNADPGKIEQVLVNLALNARDAMPDGGRMTIETANVELTQRESRPYVDLPEGSYVGLVVRDTGLGMDSATLSRVFEPFFTTKEPGKGTGLGLAVVYGIAKQSGGGISIDSEPGRGTTVEIRLPRAAEGVSECQRPPACVPSSRGDETVLLVEDDDKLRSVLCAGLHTHGYTVLEARDGREALKVCEESRQRVQLLVADVVLPLFSGRELADLLRAARPDLKVLLMSGYGRDCLISPGRPRGEKNFLEKPFTLTALLQKMREVLDTAA
jgi:two-component system cell cycle sensor histidine kinase/response regulator CckA